ncbi:unnamed protein product [Owenia fusiformis]|uniref:Deoxynucleoside kinase domain-containing protein n=1 Tax=Owenia fusiformis TaxID=6347 RepID=A0A8J1XZ53_OWEFU|nr:unnamed protein product [Owenia fusiformis]
MTLKEVIGGMQRLVCQINQHLKEVSVEGNIGCGKSTCLKYFQNSPNVEALREPLHLWCNVRGHNALELLYQDPKRWSFSFNTYVQLTRLNMHEHKTEKPVKMLERSLYSTRYCFVENDMRSGILSPLEGAVLSEWFDFTIANRDCHVDLIVYLRASPEICYDRIRKRNRKEEKCVPFQLIKDLHDLHEQWLIEQNTFKPPAPVLVIDASPDLSELHTLYDKHRQEILCGYI